MNKLFKNVIKYGYFVRKNKLDGLKYWNKLKIFVNENFDKTIEGDWNITIVTNDGNTLDEIDNIYDYFHDDLGMKGEEDDEKNENWEKYHFFLQLIRIPKKNKIDLIRLLQIAYNIGQFYSERKEGNYNEECLQVFDENNMQKHLSYTKSKVIIEQQSIINFINNIIKKTTIQNLNKKYMKYKNKYILLKNKKL